MLERCLDVMNIYIHISQEYLFFLINYSIYIFSKREIKAKSIMLVMREDTYMCVFIYLVSNNIYRLDYSVAVIVERCHLLSRMLLLAILDRARVSLLIAWNFYAVLANFVITTAEIYHFFVNVIEA